MSLIAVLILVVVLLALFYWYMTRNTNYWKDHGVPTLSSNHWFFGHYKAVLTSQKHVFTVFDEMYREFPDAPYVGFLKMDSPGLMLRDPELVKTVLSTDFPSFNKNDFYVDKNVDFLLGNNPFSQSGDEWKVARSQTTPSVTFSKLKGYFPGLLKVGDEMVKKVTKDCQEKSPVEYEAKDLAGMFTTDVISNAVFGIKNNTFKDKNSLFATLTSEVFTLLASDNLKLLIFAYFPRLFNLLGFKATSNRAETVLLSLVKKMMKERSESGDNTTDLFQQMIAHRENGKADIYTDKFIASHLYSFLLDGTETSSVFISYAMFELAWHNDIQEKLRQEIREMLTRTNGDYNAEDVENMKYLDMVASETLRLHVPAPILLKLCASDFTLPTGLAMKKDTLVAIPVGSLHMDPKYYPSPMKFDPLRFTEEAVAERNKFVFLPFGEGPRKCLGQRFALLQSKVCIIKLLQNFQLKPSPKAQYPLLIDPKVQFLRRALGGIWVQMEMLN